MNASAAIGPAARTDQTKRVNRLPRATYRLQLRNSFGFPQIMEQVDYLEMLGISDLYLSPLFHARAGSQSGYDVVDHNRIEPAFGDRQQLANLAKEMHRRDMGVLLDIVPNHMGINDPDNHLWNDVLENGPAARSEKFFDIDWNPPSGDLSNCVLLPVLGKPFGETLESGELQIVRNDDGFGVLYVDRRLPLNPTSYTEILKIAEQSLAADVDTEVRDELLSIILQLTHLTNCSQSNDRYREQAVARRRIQHQLSTSSEIENAVNSAVENINGTVGDPASFDTFERILHQQFYRLAYWRVAVDEINYRRFFDINDLAAVRVENDDVFAYLHRLTWELVQSGVVTGLRVDHIDGLLDPADYLQRLQQEYRRVVSDSSSRNLYVVVEKVLSGDETLNINWYISGSTGYEFLSLISRVMVAEQGFVQLRDFYGSVTKHLSKPREVEYQSKQAILSDAMASELYVLASRLFRIAHSSRRSIDFTLRGLLRALREVIACFPVYRTYVRPHGWEIDEEDHRRIREALRWAIVRNPTMPRAVFDFISSVLLLEFPPGTSEQQQVQWRDWVLKFQQVTGPVTAKGIEDTSFYRYYPLISLNEVGTELGAEPLGVAAFHQALIHRSQDWPRSLSATATHDTKRGEDMRARLQVLSECPDEFAAAYTAWESATNAEGPQFDSIDANVRYFIFQTLLGSWPTDSPNWNNYRERLQAYFQKAFREAKSQTSWRNPNAEFESAVTAFVDLSIPGRNSEMPNDARAFTHIERLSKRIAGPGYINSISQVILKATLPGVPDFYQGCEFWDFHLVDPDNRQPVDFQSRQEMLRNLLDRFHRSASETLESLRELSDPALKMFATMRSLQARRDAWDVFASGDYRPLQVSGEKAAHVIAFERRYQERAVIVVVPRLPFELLGKGKSSVELQDFLGRAWSDTAIHCGDNQRAKWHDSITNRNIATSGGQMELSALLRDFCTAILM